MTISEMHSAIKMELDKTSSLELPSFESEEIDYWINRTINDFIKQRIPSNKNKLTIEETKKVRDDLRTLVGPPISLTLVVNSYYPNNFCFSLPTDYLYDLEDEVIIEYTDEETGSRLQKKVPTNEVTSNTYSTHLRDPFSEHIIYKEFARPLKMVRGNEIVYVTDGDYDIIDCYFTYIKKPAVVTLTSSALTTISCDLPESVHNDIVQLAAVKMLENIESPRYMTLSNELLRSE
jgi:hypothetical protein